MADEALTPERVLDCGDATFRFQQISPSTSLIAIEDVTGAFIVLDEAQARKLREWLDKVMP